MKQIWFFIAFSVFDKKGKKLYDEFCFHTLTCLENDMKLNEADFLESCLNKANEQGKAVKDVTILITNINSLSK